MVKTGNEWVIEVEVHIQILKSDTKQDSAAVIALAIASLKEYKASHVDVEEVIFGADNAGCYHCEDTVVQLWRLKNAVEGMTILGIHFGEPGRGKMICDQYFAILKALVKRFRLANNDVDTPEKFAAAMSSDSGIANTIIQIGDIQDRVESEKKSSKRIIKDISRYYEFLFNEKGITVRYLPGFGEGELIEIANNLEEVPVPWYDFQTVNKCQKSTNLPYREDYQNINAVKGGHSGNNAQKDNSQLEDASDSEDEDLEKWVGVCDNPRCIKTFLRPSDHWKHINSNHEKCVIEVEQKSTDEQAIEMYVAKNGISQQYQGKTYRETRNMIFHAEMLPTVDEIFINSGYKDSPKKGHALPQPRVNAQFSEKQRNFLIDKFNAGTGSNKHLKKLAKEVETQMQEAGFSVDEWLTDIQIKGYFNRLCTKQKAAPVSKKGKKVVVADNPSEDPTFADLDQTVREMEADEEARELHRLEAGMDPNAATDSEDEDESHPFCAEGLNDNLCYLAADVLDSTLEHSKLKEYTNKTLIKAMESVGVKLNKKSTKVEISIAVVKFVQDKCECLLLRPNSS
jgi:hypothetical protein